MGLDAHGEKDMVKYGIPGWGDPFKMVLLLLVLGNHASAHLESGKSRALVIQGVFRACKKHLDI